MKRRLNRMVTTFAFAVLAGVVLITAATAAQLTADQRAAMQARAEESRKFLEEMTEMMKAETEIRAALRPRPNPALAQRAAEAAAQAKEAWRQKEIVPWLAEPIPQTDGQPANAETTEAATRTKLLTLASEFNSQHEETLRTAAKTGTPAEMIFPNGKRAILSSFVNGQPLWNMSDGITQAVSIATAAVWPGGGAGFSLTGTNTPIGQWEAGGIPRLTHAEFQGRVTVRDGTTNIDLHATEVASVLNAGGLYNLIYPAGVTNYQAAKGMSYAGPVWSHYASNDVSAMAGEAATNGLRVSNHSYSAACGWRWIGVWVWYGDTNVSQTTDWKFGAYYERSGWPVVLAPIAREAWRRYRKDELREDEFYCSEAQMAGICYRNPQLADEVRIQRVDFNSAKEAKA